MNHVSEGTLNTSRMLSSDNHVSEGTLITSRSLPSGIVLVKKHLLPVGCYPRNHVSEDTLITSRVLHSGNKSPSAGVLTHVVMTINM